MVGLVQIRHRTATEGSDKAFKNVLHKKEHHQQFVTNLIGKVVDALDGADKLIALL